MSEKKAHHNAQDSPEQIQMCLTCKRPRCIDCIGRNLQVDHNGCIIRPNLLNNVRINKTDRDVLAYYATSRSDREIAEKIGRPVPTISGVRRKLNLPSPRSTPEESKREAVEFWLERGRSA